MNQSSSIDQLRRDVINAEAELSKIQQVQGKGSSTYQKALKRFAMAWYLLRKKHSPEAFLKDLI